MSAQQSADTVRYLGKGVKVDKEPLTDHPPEREPWKPTEMVPLDPYRGLGETSVPKYDNGWPILGDATG